MHNNNVNVCISSVQSSNNYKFKKSNPKRGKVDEFRIFKKSGKVESCYCIHII